MMAGFPCRSLFQAPDRRSFLSQFGMGLGSLALAQIMGQESAASVTEAQRSGEGVLEKLHYPPMAKRVIFLFQAGGPSQHDLFDYKPLLNEKHGEQLPDKVRGKQKLTGMSGNQSSLPLVGSPFKFKQHGQSGRWVSELLPHTAKIVDELCVIKSMETDAINHGPAVTFIQTGSQIPGRPSIGAWLNYGLGSQNENLPSFVVLVTRNQGGQPLQARLWGSGFLPSRHQGVRFLNGRDPVLYLGNPDGMSIENRRAMLDTLNGLHQHQLEKGADSLVESRIAQYELGFRMQESIPEATELADEPESVLRAYGPNAGKPGTYASNCILARRLAERGVQFIQLYHQGWDQHSNLPGQIRNQCQETDQASAALVMDLKQRGLLDDTLVVWGGEFGRTNYCQGKLGNGKFGRDHHPRCFTIWMAGGGVKPGFEYGLTDPLGYNILEDKVHVHDFQAMLMRILGIDHEKLTYKHQGRRYRLTDVHGEIPERLLPGLS